MWTREVGQADKDERIVADVRELESILREAGLDEQRLKVRIEEGAPHSETAWAARFPEALEFLYSDRASPQAADFSVRQAPGGIT
jgi:predicted alpha/beta superfamily hydrolase